MTTSKIFAYCERGLDPGFWAEPLNALSSLAFLGAAAVGFRLWRHEQAARSGKAAQDRRLVELALVLLVALIGTGSVLFHTFATPWAKVADIGPIAVFMIGYLAFALRRMLRLGRFVSAGWVLAFLATIVIGAQASCHGAPCYNGSLLYAPALGALIVVAALLRMRGHAAAGALALAAAMLAVSLVLRTIDRAVCPYTLLAARAVGTHFLWHLINAAMMVLLLRTALRYGALGQADTGSTATRPATLSAKA